jgi:hypothetical protein
MEAKKVLKNIDLTCFRHVFKPKRDGRENQFYWMGTSPAFEELDSLFEIQLSMAKEFGVATREIFFKNPWQFKEPIPKSETEGLTWNNRKISLEFLDSLKIKLDISRETSQVVLLYPHIEVTSSQSDFEQILEVCRFRQTDQTHGILFFHVDDESPAIHCSPMGDWLGIE